MGNLCTLVNDPRDMQPYVPLLLPELKVGAGVKQTAALLLPCSHRMQPCVLLPLLLSQEMVFVCHRAPQLLLISSHLGLARQRMLPVHTALLSCNAGGPGGPLLVLWRAFLILHSPVHADCCLSAIAHTAVFSNAGGPGGPPARGPRHSRQGSGLPRQGCACCC